MTSVYPASSGGKYEGIMINGRYKMNLIVPNASNEAHIPSGKKAKESSPILMGTSMRGSSRTDSKLPPAPVPSTHWAQICDKHNSPRLPSRFNGRGTLYFPGKGKYEGKWEAGRCVKGEYIFADNLKYNETKWMYCSEVFLAAASHITILLV